MTNYLLSTVPAWELALGFCGISYLYIETGHRKWDQCVERDRYYNGDDNDLVNALENPDATRLEKVLARLFKGFFLAFWAILLPMGGVVAAFQHWFGSKR